MLNSFIDSLLIISTIISFVLAFIVYASNRKVLENIFLSLSICGSAIWGFSIYITLITANPTIAKIPFAIVALLPNLLLLFAYAFAKEKISLIKYSIILMPSLVLSSLALSDKLLFGNVIVKEGIITTSDPGVLLPYYGIYLVILFIILGWKLISIYLQAHGIRRIQLGFVMFGLLSTASLALITNMILPLFGIFSLNNMGPVFTLLLSGSMVYAATKHHLLDIKVIFSEIWALLLVLLVTVWCITNFSIFNFLLLVMVYVIAILFIRSVLSEVEKNEDIKKNNRQLEQDKKDLMDLDRMKDEFLQMATHELNTPITVIKGKLNMAIDEDMCHLNDEQKDFLRPVLNDTERLSRLSRDILDTARIDQNRLKINAVEGDLDILIIQLVSGFAVNAKERNNSVNYIPVTRPLPKITFDQTKISEVINNLLTNANKFTENGKIVASAKVQDKFVVISVADTGIGINKEDQNNLFHKFYQAGRFDPEEPQEQQGTGLGLYISRSIVQLHGGKMWLESAQGKGSTFYFSLPLEYHKVVMPSKLHIEAEKLRVL
ncbi:MAG: ATP-binding protein [Candidatus Omnitrophica bacterium]|nr:ATP-binding protein [Candidatus Omnitrophota bacterium]